MNWPRCCDWTVWVAFGFAVSGVANVDGATISFKKTVVDKAFRAEGIAVGDVNHDGKNDLLAGEFWYEAPDWKPHELAAPGNYKDGAGGYSQCFACWADDMNEDGWIDLLVVGLPAAPCHWLENPQNKPGHWKRHILSSSACNESPQYVDLVGSGKKVLVMGHNDREIAFFSRPSDVTMPWQKNQISEAGKKAAGAFRYDHGLGVGDVNGDKRLDVICKSGWYEQPEKVEAASPWKFHPVGITDDCADMHLCDFDGNGTADVLSSSAHNYGIWVSLQAKDGKGEGFTRQTLFPKLFSQSHALQYCDMNGDGFADLITGKRHWAHGPNGDADPMAPSVLYWFEGSKVEGVLKFEPHQIDDGSGVGTQFWVGDCNGDKLPDIAVANKMGVFLFEQQPAP